MAAQEQKEQRKKVIIIGAGPTGLGAAWRLHELAQKGHAGAQACDWLLLDQSPTAGGLACSVVDDQGFTWDMGGHVVFSHYQYFTDLLESLNDDWNKLEREAWVWMRDKFIPYPFQNNIWRLPKEELLACLDGLLDVERQKGKMGKAKNFHEWLEQGFGKGLMDVFMTPYNKKVWAYPPEDMNVEWMGERVATVDLKQVFRNIVLKQDSLGWGPNATFTFPVKGGTGSIWTALFERLPKKNVRLGSTVVGVDTTAKTVTLGDGAVLPYDHLISTMPLDLLCKLSNSLPGYTRADLDAAALKFKYSSSHIIGFGIEGTPPEHLKTKCWMYFPEDDCPYYRGTVFSNYSKYHVPKPDEQWSLMLEVSESGKKPVDVENILAITEKGLLANKLITKDDVIVSRYHIRLEHGYPTPFFGRDELCVPIFKALETVGIKSRGRFGAWKYEVSNQDHSMMQGVEAADNVLFGTVENTFFNPSVVNKGRGEAKKGQK